MKFIGEVNVLPQLPDSLKRLEELAHNFYFAWHRDVQGIFRTMDEDLWRTTNHNPVMFLRKISQQKIENFASDTDFLQKLSGIFYDFDEYMNGNNTWFSRKFPQYKNDTIAYFSAEFGVHESLPIYSGGLGVLAGDHLKSASDLGLPLIAIGLAYHQAYFSQRINASGQQIAEYPTYKFDEMPMTLEKDKKGKPIVIAVELAGRQVYAQIWRAQVGRVPLFLLDANIEDNAEKDRELTARLYGGDQEMRISQEILLGMGGVKAVRKLGYNPSAWHMNEGHSVFLGLSRIREYVENEGLDFYSALEAVSSNNLFTTHTPVPAGNDAFPLTLKEKYFRNYWESVNIKRHAFMDLGLEIQPEGYQIFSLTILAFNISRFSNAVSHLHGQVSRKLWKNVWPDTPTEEVPIDYVTNGIHTMSWVGRDMAELYDKYLGKQWRQKLASQDFWNSIQDIPDEALWKTKRMLKEKMVRHLNRRLKEQYAKNNMGIIQARKAENLLNPDALIIGFARRFATYKRAALIFRDKERLLRILNNREKPVQIVFAGKAHPKDRPGQEVIKQIYQLSQTDEFKGKIVIVEGYDINMARHLIAGVDVWLNNPRRPHEASGTSGQKVPVNGGINLSVLDGWWVEGYNGKNGWAFGDSDVENDQELQDTIDSVELYELLEQEVIPSYFTRTEAGIPAEWLRIMKESIRSVIARFSTHRMVMDYVNKLYIPAIENGKKFIKGNFKLAKELAAWKDKIEQNWNLTRLYLPESAAPVINSTMSYKEKRTIEVVAQLGNLKPDDVLVEIYLKQVTGSNQATRFSTIPMRVKKELNEGEYLFEGQINPSESGHFRYTIRMVPHHEGLVHKHEMHFVKWVE